MHLLTCADPPKFDLESYISNYDGHMRLERLVHIGSHSTYLAIDAWRAAIAEAKQGKNVQLYLRMAESFADVAPEDPATAIDTAWAEKKTREVKAEQDKLEHELKSYKNNLIKESIRVCVGGLRPVVGVQDASKEQDSRHVSGVLAHNSMC
jgi:COP9 signalosome complex subunit 1